MKSLQHVPPQHLEAIVSFLKAADVGEKIEAAASEGGKARALAKQQERKGQKEVWQGIAEEVWRNNPRLSKMAVTRIIVERLKGQKHLLADDQVIYKTIKRPNS